MSVVTWSESFPPKPTFTEKDVPDQHGRVFIVTGGSSGCGFEVAKAVYNLNGRVYIAGRSAENAERAIQSIKSEAPAQQQTVKRGKGEPFFLHLDLNDLATIKASADKFLSLESRLDVVWHNAGLGGAPQGSVTAQGFETHLGINALGPFLFQHFLTPLCLETASRPEISHDATRVIWVTSSGHRGSPKPDGVNWTDMNMHTMGGVKGGMFKYGQSKAMCVMFAHEFARRYGPRGLVSLSLHPGSVKTNFQRHQPSLFKTITSPLLYDQHYGGLTELFAGFGEVANMSMIQDGGRNGSYVEPWGRWGAGSKYVFGGLLQRNTGARLWKVCEEMLKNYV
ncbi:short-chain alcohol dehydrogenase [Neonectria punicea]|uniref:Short-chain alcohol dehydrogenase n=1 Tax=Neonectria punicea TaxID=979145 RepID=A0ABR1GI30_9HYPO